HAGNGPARGPRLRPERRGARAAHADAARAPRLPRRLARARGPDVLVQPEDVLGVVAVLQGDEPLVLLRAVGGPDPLLAVVRVQEVEVGPAGRKAPQGPRGCAD